MKKLFALFLLVALVPFSIGCFGGSSDDGVAIDLKTLSASAVLPKAAGDNLNLRGVAVNHFKNVTMKIGDVTLEAVDEVTTDSGNTYTVTFQKVVSSAAYTAATTGIVPVTIKKNDGTELKLAMDLTNVTSIALTVAADNTVTATTGTVFAASKFVSVSNITGATNTLTPIFTVKFSGDIGSIANPKSFDVKVISGTSMIAASIADFNTSYDATNTSMTVALKDKTLTNGKTYTVLINKLVSSTDIAVLSTSHTFTVALTQ